MGISAYAANRNSASPLSTHAVRVASNNGSGDMLSCSRLFVSRRPRSKNEHVTKHTAGSLGVYREHLSQPHGPSHLTSRDSQAKVADGGELCRPLEHGGPSCGVRSQAGV